MSNGQILAELVRVQAIFQLRAIQTAMGIDAQGMEARRAETGTGSVHDSPVAESDAP